MNTGMRWGLLLSAVAILTAVVIFTYGSPSGADLFKNQGCIGCHSFKGKGGQACPDLTAVKSRRSDAWIRDQIKNPVKHNPDTRMPAFDNLSYREISAIIRYLKS